MWAISNGKSADMKTEKPAELTSIANALQALLPKGISLLLLTVASIAGVAYMAPWTGHADEQASPTFVEKIPEGYRDWKLIAASRLTTAKGNQLRTELGNDIAIKAYREGKLPFPDGAIIAALHWNEVSSEQNNEVLAKGFPNAGIQSFVPGSIVNMQFMVKDSKKYAATGGWGFGDFNNGKPGNAALMKTCFSCHEPARDRDFVFTRYAP